MDSIDIYGQTKNLDFRKCSVIIFLLENTLLSTHDNAFVFSDKKLCFYEVYKRK